MDQDRLKGLTLAPDATVRSAMQRLDQGRQQIVLVVDGDGRLKATVTDGDIRRGLLGGASLDDPIANVMHTSPTTVSAEDDPDAVRGLIRQRKLKQIPVIDADGRLVDLLIADDLFGLTPKETRVVLMAGGLGTRLRPLTETVPKPMLPVGGRPLLEQIVGEFANQGFQRFSISVNYKKEMVQDHFGDGSAYGVSIDYIEETESMGTAGALSLMTEAPTSPIIVMNGDVLVSLNFATLLDHHRATEASATMVVREYTHQIPYGVVRTQGDYMTDIVEKPVERYFVNAGIYVISPEAVATIPTGQPKDMPSLFEDINTAGQKVAVFPLRDYWRDIGQIQDLEAARSEFESVFRP